MSNDTKIESQISEVGFAVYGEPVPKQRPRTVRNSDKYGRANVHTYTPSKTKEHEKKIAYVYKSIYGDFKFEKGVPLLVVVQFFMRMPGSAKKKDEEAMLSGEMRPTKKPDIDNMLKLVTDALNGVAFEDDSQIVDTMCKKHWSKEPRTEVFIARLDNDE